MVIPARAGAAGAALERNGRRAAQAGPRADRGVHVDAGLREGGLGHGVHPVRPEGHRRVGAVPRADGLPDGGDRRLRRTAARRCRRLGAAQGQDRRRREHLIRVGGRGQPRRTTTGSRPPGCSSSTTTPSPAESTSTRRGATRTTTSATTSSPGTTAMSIDFRGGHKPAPQTTGTLRDSPDDPAGRAGRDPRSSDSCAARPLLTSPEWGRSRASTGRCRLGAGGRSWSPGRAASPCSAPASRAAGRWRTAR